MTSEDPVSHYVGESRPLLLPLLAFGDDRLNPGARSNVPQRMPRVPLRERGRRHAHVHRRRLVDHHAVHFVRSRLLRGFRVRDGRRLEPFVGVAQVLERLGFADGRDAGGVDLGAVEDPHQGTGARVPLHNAGEVSPHAPHRTAIRHELVHERHLLDEDRYLLDDLEVDAVHHGDVVPAPAPEAIAADKHHALGRLANVSEAQDERLRPVLGLREELVVADDLAGFGDQLRVPSWSRWTTGTGA